jgi:hypothetical protein
MSLADELRERVAADQAARYATDSLVENGKVAEMTSLACGDNGHCPSGLGQAA